MESAEDLNPFLASGCYCYFAAYLKKDRYFIRQTEGWGPKSKAFSEFGRGPKSKVFTEFEKIKNQKEVMEIWGRMKNKGIQGAMMMVVNVPSINAYKNCPS